ncbi:hypothetical protein [Pelagicoccus sp. SDUM812002]|uniref:hypothetical protein n=1 Tax=Pelagicoccus sp. SDUM812002 TaxID=3041266 RepID=UPI0028100803|nr:hypothetical protein [Pelagicoccus sp. SDUM812002]MDQ8188513.1 hypothetical protein [Pelagicoccus sp. SDUM812002]
MEPNQLPFYRIENIGLFGYIKTIILGKNREVRWIDQLSDGKKEKIQGEYTATISKKAFLLTVYSESERRRVPVIVIKWKRSRDEIAEAMFGGMSAFEDIDHYFDSNDLKWSYWKKGCVTCHNESGEETTKIYLR